jgi:imidazole glycerol-phosphate synthase subunit HisH
MIGLINYGSGNYRSVSNALNHLKLAFKEIKNPDDFQENITHIILPGVGTFGDCMGRLEKQNLIPTLLQKIKNLEVIFLGICVGHQVLADLGTEFKETKGLGLIQGIVEKISPDNNLPIPHIGWTEVDYERDSPLFKDIDSGSTFYFVHSYELIAKSDNEISSTGRYGTQIIASVQKGNVFGVQFHPEKSQHNGLKVLRNFSEIQIKNLG